MGLQSRSEYIGEGLTKNSMYAQPERDHWRTLLRHQSGGAIHLVAGTAGVGVPTI